MRGVNTNCPETQRQNVGEIETKPRADTPPQRRAVRLARKVQVKSLRQRREHRAEPRFSFNTFGTNVERTTRALSARWNRAHGVRDEGGPAKSDSRGEPARGTRRRRD